MERLTLRMRGMLEPFMLRRLKGEVASQLTAKRHEERRVPMVPVQVHPCALNPRTSPPRRHEARAHGARGVGRVQHPLRATSWCSTVSIRRQTAVMNGFCNRRYDASLHGWEHAQAFTDVTAPRIVIMCGYTGDTAVVMWAPGSIRYGVGTSLMLSLPKHVLRGDGPEGSPLPVPRLRSARTVCTWRATVAAACCLW